MLVACVNNIFLFVYGWLNWSLKSILVYYETDSQSWSLEVIIKVAS